MGVGAGGPGGWWIIDEPEVHFVSDIEIMVPDLADWRKDRMPSSPEGHKIQVVPDWICEILSRPRKARIAKKRYRCMHITAFDSPGLSTRRHARSRRMSSLVASGDP
jgi:hypothetical protein